MVNEYGFSKIILGEPPVEEFSEFFSKDNAKKGNYHTPEPIQELGIILMTLMEAKLMHDNNAVTYTKKFLEEFYPDSNNYNALSDQGKEIINQIVGSDDEFISHVINQIES